MEKRKLKAIRLFEKEITPAEAALRLSVHHQSATRWRKEWLAGVNSLSRVSNSSVINGSFDVTNGL